MSRSECLVWQSTNISPVYLQTVEQAYVYYLHAHWPRLSRYFLHCVDAVVCDSKIVWVEVGRPWQPQRLSNHRFLHPSWKCLLPRYSYADYYYHLLSPHDEVVVDPTSQVEFPKTTIFGQVFESALLLLLPVL